MKGALYLVLSLALSLSFLSSPPGTPAGVLAAGLSDAVPGGEEKIDPRLRAEMDAANAGQMITAIVTMRDQADFAGIPGATRAARLQGVIRALQVQAAASQRQVAALLAARQAQGAVREVRPFWVFDGLSVTAVPAVLAELAARDDVARITPDALDVIPAAPLAVSRVEPNLAVVNAPAVWSLGWTGQGVVVANLDTGVDVAHPDLAGRWRGGSNSWFDPYGQHPTTPTDLSGHGTATMSLIVGGDAGGSAIGMAPGSRWIAARIFDDGGVSTATAIHQAFQWLLDPDGNPDTADAPQVVNNSWTFGAPGCNLEFQLDLAALRASGILPVFAAGNFGPYSSTSASPANYPEAFAVGATANDDTLYTYSSRGPSACGEMTVYPDLVAPGVDVRTADLFGMYGQQTGTSLAAPQVAGALALLLSAFAGLTAYQQEAALLSGATDLGASGPDNDFGNGRLDVLAAYTFAQNAAFRTPTPTPSPTSTPTPAPASTVTAVPAFHIGDIDAATATSKSGWTATLTLVAHTASHAPQSSVTITGSWSGGYNGTASCTTGQSGTCSLKTGGIGKKVASVTFAVFEARHPSLFYDPSANHDPDGDSNGTAITVNRP